MHARKHLHLSPQPLRTESLLARKMLIESRLRNLRLRDDLVDPHTLVATLSEEASSGSNESFSRLAHALPSNRFVCFSSDQSKAQAHAPRIQSCRGIRETGRIVINELRRDSCSKLTAWNPCRLSGATPGDLQTEAPRGEGALTLSRE